jgi:hypothetical protein
MLERNDDGMTDKRKRDKVMKRVEECKNGNEGM